MSAWQRGRLTKPRPIDCATSCRKACVTSCRSLRSAVDHSVHYLNVFEALGRLPQERDDALEFLIDFADLVASEEKDIELAAVTKALEDDDEDRSKRVYRV